MAEDDLDLSALGIDESEPYEMPEELPNQFGLFWPTPQPSNAYSFLIPAGAVWLPAQQLENGVPVNRPIGYWRKVKDKPQTHLATPWEIMASPKDEFNSQPFDVAISTLRRPRNKEKSVLVSDAVYLIRALNPAYVLKDVPLLQLIRDLNTLAAGNLVDATVEWNGSCNPKRPIFSKTKGEVIEGKNGCGMKYALKRRKDNTPKAPFTHVEAIPKEGGRWVERFPCANPKCDAMIRTFPQLGNFRPPSVSFAEEEEA